MIYQEIERQGKLLVGKTFISTRPAGKSEELGKCLKLHGAILIEMPMIEICQAQITEQEKELLKHISEFDWIVFTSANGITHFFEHLKHITGSYSLSRSTKIAVIGKKTAFGLGTFGYQAQYINKGSTSDDFSTALRELFKTETPKVLLPVGNLAGENIEHKLKDIANIARVNVYKTEMPKSTNIEVLKRIADNNYEMIIFTSPSGFINFQLTAGDSINLKTLRMACIGNTTAEAIKTAGSEPLVVSNSMNSQGIVEAILIYYKNF